MIEAWRVCRRPYADLSGEGASRYGGRWNHRGWPMVYLAERPALAVLEVLVHLDLPIELVPEDYVLVRAELPGRPVEATLGAGDDPAAFGHAWLLAKHEAVLRVPSILVPHGRNLLLNPLHKAATRARIVTMEPFRFDPRLRLIPA